MNIGDEYEDTQPADLKWFARGHIKGKEFKALKDHQEGDE